MPLYEYECSACGHRFEVIQRFSDAPIEKCQSCKTGDVHKLLSAPAIQFKGTGWYVTDYAGKNKGGSGSASTPPAASDASSSGDTSSASGSSEPAKPASTSSKTE